MTGTADAPDPPDRATALLEDILAEPATLAALLEAYAKPDGPLDSIPAGLGGGRLRVVFSGLGSSHNAGLDAATALRGTGVAAWAEVASTDSPTPPSPDLVLVAISASGRTPEVVAAIERHRGTSLVVGLTNRPDEPVGRKADVVLPLLAGVETAGVACRTYQATNAVLALLSDRLAARGPGAGDGPVARLRPAVDALAAVIDSRAGWLEAAADALHRAHHVGVLGPSGQQGLVEQAALMLREGPRMVAAAHETGDWLHTAVYTALPGHAAIVIRGTPHDETVIDTIAGRGGAVVVVGAPGDLAVRGQRVHVPVSTGLDPAARRLVLSVVAELLAAALWARSDGQRKEP